MWYDEICIAVCTNAATWSIICNKRIDSTMMRLLNFAHCRKARYVKNGLLNTRYSQYASSSSSSSSTATLSSLIFMPSASTPTLPIRHLVLIASFSSCPCGISQSPMYATRVFVAAVVGSWWHEPLFSTLSRIVVVVVKLVFDHCWWWVRIMIFIVKHVLPLVISLDRFLGCNKLMFFVVVVSWRWRICDMNCNSDAICGLFMYIIWKYRSCDQIFKEKEGLLSLLVLGFLLKLAELE